MTTEIIPKIPDGAAQQQWENAAATWRLPFWDWALKKARPEDSTDPGSTKLIYDVPVIAKYPKVDVLDYQKGAASLTVTIDNPMYKFTIPGTAPMGSYGINDIQAKTETGRFRTTPVRPSSRPALFLKADTRLVLQIQKLVPLGGLCTPAGRNQQQLGRWYRQQRPCCGSSPNGPVVQFRRRRRTTR